MLQKILKYLGIGWHTAKNLHTAHWIIVVMISLLPASVTTALVGVMGEHSVFLLGVVFLLCFGIISLMTFALLGHPIQIATERRSLVNAGTITSKSIAAADAGRLPEDSPSIAPSALSEAQYLRGERYRPCAPDDIFEIIEARPETPADESRLIYKRKLRVILRSRSHQNMEVMAPDWICSGGYVPFQSQPAPHFWSLLEPEDIAAGGWM